PVRLDRATLARLRAELGPQATFTFRTAVEALQHNKLRASLTSLGILFGVASVIAMLAIGKGAEREILEQLRLLGSNNLLITPLVQQKEGPIEERSEKEVKKFSPGLTYADAEAIARVIPAVDVACAEIVLNTTITREGRHRSGKVVGVDTTYFRLTNLALASGDPFTPLQVERGLPVAIIGLGVRSRFFTTEDPIGKPLKVGSNWVTVIGVLADRRVSTQTTQKLGIRDISMDVYVPAPKLLLKQEQRTKTIFNVVLGAIASISLVVGGIGIMNIMLASVLERIREIGVRRAVGATRRDILLQFLSEAVLISVAGGGAGILVGGGLSAAIQRFAGIQTIVSYLSVVVAFGVSFTVGLAFGIMPAHRAARQDPVVCLRYE